MSTPSIYIKSLEIRNLRTFVDVAIDFEKPDGSLPQWTIILGDNSIGKSTLLQSIAWMKPKVPDLGDSTGQKIKKKDIEPIINNEENETLERLVRKGISDKESTFIKGNFIAGHELPGKKQPAKSPWCYSRMEILLGKDKKLKEVNHGFDTNAEKIFLKNEIFIFCYSASRVLGKANINDTYVKDTIANFLDDATVLYDAEEIIHTINYAALGASKDEQEKYSNYLIKVIEALVSILPDVTSVEDIQITTPKLVMNQIRQGELLISTKHGKKIPFKDFSLGYKTVMSWVVDLSWRLFNEYPKSPSPLNEPAIVIVDEIDLHLHPIWQREIIQNLSKHFPKVQFIATAHSPLLVQAALKENYAVLKYGEDGVEILNEPEGIDGWRVDQILTSDFFGLKTARGLEYEQLMNERELLLRKKSPSNEDLSRLEAVTKLLSDYPTSETPDEIENRKLISDLAEKIKTKKIKIQL